MLGAACLALYGVVVVNTVPRLSGAAPGTLAYVSYAAVAVTGLYGVHSSFHAVKASAATIPRMWAGPPPGDTANGPVLTKARGEYGPVQEPVRARRVRRWS